MLHADRTANLLGALMGALQDRIDEDLVQEQVECASDFAALNLIAQRPGLTGKDLVPLLGLSQSSVARLVDRLETRGLLARSRVEDDKRQFSLKVPGPASRRVAKIVGRRMGVLRDTLSHLPPQDRQAMASLLEAMLAGLTRSREEAERICRYCDEQACPLEDCPVECKARALEAGAGR